MSERVDDLFAPENGGGAKLTGSLILIGTGSALALVGMLCSAAPGGLMVLVGLMRIEGERQRIDNGALPESARKSVNSALRMAYVATAVVVALFMAQVLLLCFGVYEDLWGALFYALRPFLAMLFDLPDAPTP